MGYPRFQRARNFKVQTAASDITITATAMAAVPVISDLVLEAQSGDVLEIGVQTRWDTGSMYGRLVAATIVSGSPVSYAGGSSAGLGSWLGLTGALTSIGPPAFLTLGTGDISNGTVTVRWYARLDSAGSRVLGYAADLTQFWVKNLGPADPH